MSVKGFLKASFDIFRGLPDAAERKLNTEPYWTFDWDTGERRQVGKSAQTGATKKTARHYPRPKARL